MKFNAKIVLAGAAVVAGLAMVGAGAGASFTDSASAAQHIDTGTLVLNVNSDGTQSSDAHSVTWSITNSGSQINQQHVIQLINHGSLPLTLTTANFSDSTGGNALADQLQGSFADFTASLSQLEGTPFICQGSDCTLAPNGGELDVPLNFTGDLTNAAEGQSVDPTVTFGAVEANPSHHNAPLANSTRGAKWVVKG